MAELSLKIPLVNKGFKGKLLTYRMGWTGSTGRVWHVTRAVQTDPFVQEAELVNMQALGFEGVICQVQGPTVNPFEHASTMNFCERVAKAGMIFGLILDPWIAKQQPNPTQAAIAALQHPDYQELFNHSNYLPEKYIVEFNLAQAAGVVIAQLQAALPNMPILSWHTGFSWPTVNFSLQQLIKENSNPAMRMPALFSRFFDGGAPTPAGALSKASIWDGKREYNSSVWSSPGSNDVRTLEHEFGNVYLDTVDALPLNAPYATYATWDDFDEGTYLGHIAPMFTGVRIGK